MRRRFILLGILALTLSLLGESDVQAQKKKSPDVVKATAKADKPGEDGKQVVTIKLDIDKAYHIYANPVGHADFEDNKTTVSVTGKEKLASLKVEYPAGEEKEDKTIGKYKVYKGTVTIKAVVERAKGDTSELSVEIAVQACSGTSCLQPGTIKVNVP